MQTREAALLIIGDELLAGRVEDVHGPFLASCLQKLGFQLRSIQILPDDVIAISEAVKAEIARPGTRLIVTCGGVGPTPDDITYESVATALDVPLVCSEQIMRWVAEWCPPVRQERARRLLERMAWIPEGSYLIAPNDLNGPLVCMDGGNGKTLVMLPGQPELVRQLALTALVPFLQDSATPPVATEELRHSVPEALLGPCFDLLAAEFPEVRVGSYPGEPMVLRFTGSSGDVQRAAHGAHRMIERLAAELDQIETDTTRLTSDVRVEAAVRALRHGRMIVVTDDTDREDEADLIVPAESVTTEQMTFVIQHTSGIVCVPLEASRADELELVPMTSENTDPHGTAFTVSVDHSSTGTGVSAADRARTARSLAEGTTRPAELRRPGHIFPLRARTGGVLKRAGHTEAAVDFMRIAGLAPVAVISELAAIDGSMMRGSAVAKFASKHDLPVVSVADLVRYRRARERLVERSGHASLPTSHGTFEAFAYRDMHGNEHLALVHGDLNDVRPDGVLTRVHSECLTGDIMGSLRCDCGYQLHSALEKVAAEGMGVVVYLRGHEGRGIGLGHKLQAYALQEAGFDTVAANLQLGLPVDDREYGVGAQILIDLGVQRIRLITNNPAKYAGLDGYDLHILERIPSPPFVTDENTEYLRAKRDLMGHEISINL